MHDDQDLTFLDSITSCLSSCERFIFPGSSPKPKGRHVWNRDTVEVVHASLYQHEPVWSLSVPFDSRK